jgi:putative RNA 2'-phosphotransferase
MGISLDSQGGVSVDELIAKSHASADAARIGAVQGHSVDEDLGLTGKEPPALLYHGTATRFVASILVEGLKPKSRPQVH